MLSKATLIFFSYVALMGFAPKTNARIAPIFFKARYRSTNNIQLQEINKTSNVLLANSSGSRAYMTLTSIGRKNAIGNPIYLLSLYVNGEKIDAYPTVTGRAHTQNRDRHISGTEAPLPSGRYSVARSIVKGTHSEVGGRFFTNFSTISDWSLCIRYSLRSFF